MADRYWVGGSGNWDASSTANWSDSSGGSSGASAPTSADNVIFDAASNTGTGAFTVTVTGTSSAPAACADFSTGGAGGALDGAMTLTMGATARLDCYGSMTIPATNFSFSITTNAELRFQATTTGKTITTNGVSLGVLIIYFTGVGGEWTLGSAITGSANIQFSNGTLNTANYSVTAANIAIQLTGTRTLSLGSSSVTLSGASCFTYNGSNLTFNAGTSTITCSAASPIFTGGGLTFYNVTFSSASTGTTTINGTNTFNDLTFTSRSATGIRSHAMAANQTISGTLTIGAANTAIRRMRFASATVGTQRTITLNGTLATLADVDFKDIATAGSAGTWTGTRLGNAGNVSGITTDAPKTVYWNLAGTQNWSATGWATTNNGVPAVNNFPLAQDTAVFTEAGAAGTVTIDVNWNIGSIQMADGTSNRTTAFTLANGANTPNIYGNVTFFSNLTLSGTGLISFAGTSTQVITSAGISWTQPLTVNVPSSTFQLADNLTNTGTAFTLTQGTLDLSSGNRTLTCVTFSSSNSNTRSISFGTGNITVTGSAATVWNMGTVTNFTFTGTPTVNLTYSGATGTRAISFTTGTTETNALNFNVTAGTDTVTLPFVSKNFNFTGFSGTWSLGASGSSLIYGDFTLSSGMTITGGGTTLIFAATSGTQKITTAGKTLDTPITQNAPGAIVQCQDALTLGSTKTLTLINGTLQLKAGVTSTVGNFATSGTNQKFLQSTLAGTQATLSKASGAVDVSYLTIQDINATGGATWNAYLYNANVDAGNNTNWNFQGGPGIGGRGLLPAFGFGFTL